MGLDSFPSLLTQVRKDLLGFAKYNRILNRFRWLEGVFSQEHLNLDGASVGVKGECNAAEVPREVGSLEVTAGPAYTRHNFRYASAAATPAVGTCTLTLPAGVYNDVDQMGVQLQNCSETGINKPVMTTVEFVSKTSVKFHHSYLSSALGAGNTWAAEDANFCVALHGMPFPSGKQTAQLGKVKGNWLTEASNDWNNFVQSGADLWSKFQVSHSTAGVHTNREVARTWANVGVRAGGGVYDLLETSTRNALSVTRPGLGICRLTNSSAWTLDAQPFVMLDYQRLNGGAETDIYACATPRSLITTTTIDVYIYKYTPGSPGTWARADTDFFIAVHAG